MNTKPAAAVSLLVVLAIAEVILVSTWTPLTYSLVDNPESNSYTIWREEDHYNARNDWSGTIDYSDSNFTHVVDQVLNAMPIEGGIVNLRQGYYDGWIVINRSGIAFCWH